MPAAKKPTKTLSQRLARYGLQDHAKQLTELRVMRGTQLHLTLGHPDHRGKAVVLRVRTAAELKQWLGVPNGAVAQSNAVPKKQKNFISRAGCYPFVPHPRTPFFNDPALNSSLMSYLLHDTTKVPPAEVNVLNNRLVDSEVNVAIYLFSDIYIDNDSTLLVDTKIQTLFAGNIYIGNDNGRLEMQSPVASIDCFGIQSFPGL